MCAKKKTRQKEKTTNSQTSHRFKASHQLLPASPTNASHGLACTKHGTNGEKILPDVTRHGASCGRLHHRHTSQYRSQVTDVVMYAKAVKLSTSRNKSKNQHNEKGILVRGTTKQNKTKKGK
jgi:hypothetical protein